MPGLKNLSRLNLQSQMLRIEQRPTFRRAYKKLHANQLEAVNEAIKHIADNPDIGTDKVGDLSGVKIYKFRCVDQEYLLAYEIGDDVCILLAIGPHENFYRDLKK